MKKETRNLTQPLFDYLCTLSESERYNQINDIIWSLNELTDYPIFSSDVKDLLDHENVMSAQFGHYLVQRIWYNNKSEIRKEEIINDFESLVDNIDISELPNFEDDLPF